MANEIKISEKTQKVIDVLKDHAGEALTFAEIKAEAGEVSTANLVAAMKVINVTANEGGVAYIYNAGETAVEVSKDSKVSDASKAVADYFSAHEGEEVTLAGMSADLGFTVKSGHITGARVILGKENIVRIERARTYMYSAE